MKFRDSYLESFWDEPDRYPVALQVPANLRKLAYRKLQMLSAANALQDLSVPPSNRLEKLGHDREGWYSIRVNDEYRLRFVWTDEGAEGVEFVDYH